MNAKRRRRGGPLGALLLVLGSWVAMRTLTWDALAITSIAGSEAPRFIAAPRLASRRPADRPPPSGGAANPAAAPIAPAPRYVYYVPWPVAGAPGRVAYIRQAASAPGARTGGAPPAAGGWFGFSLPPGDRAGLADAPRDGKGARGATGFPGGNAAPPAAIAARADAPARRWSGDAWMLLRGAAAGPLANGALPASYGASQAGAVLRYGFAPGSGHRPAAYIRASGALNSATTDIEGALGLQARPLASVPLILAGELRATHDDGSTRLRPAAFAYTQLPPLALPLGLRGEAYLQGGYVAGAGATPFIDGQLRVDRALGVYRRALVRVGGGVWGGAQRGASRLDLGPGATLGVGLGRAVSARIALDYRLRVLGDAEPGSGPALTVSAGF